MTARHSGNNATRAVYKQQRTGKPSSRQEGAAPLMGDHEMSSRLYAGNSEYPVVLVHQCLTPHLG